MESHSAAVQSHSTATAPSGPYRSFRRAASLVALVTGLAAFLAPSLQAALYPVTNLGAPASKIGAATLWVPDRSPHRPLRGTFCIFLRDLWSVDLFLDPEWRTFWSQEGFAIMLFGVGGFQRWFTETDARGADMRVTYHGEQVSLAEAHLRVLADAARLSGHPELATAPLIWWGHSNTTYASTQMTAYVPERTVAYINYHGQSIWPLTGDFYFHHADAARDVPAIVTGGRCDTTLPWDKTRNIYTAARATEEDRPCTGGIDIDLPHGSGLYAPTPKNPNSAFMAAPARTDPHHFWTAGNQLASPATPPHRRTSLERYNYLSRKAYLMPALHAIIEQRLAGSAPGALRRIDLNAGWLGRFPTQLPAPAAEVAAGDFPLGDFSIQPYATASVADRAGSLWIPNRWLARIWQAYFSAGDPRFVPAGDGQVGITALQPTASPGSGDAALGVFEITRPGADAWRLDEGCGAPYKNNRTDTERWVTVSIVPESTTAVLGVDYLIEGTPFVSPNLAGLENDGFGSDADPPGDIPPNLIPRYYQEPGKVRFFDRSPYAYVTIRALRKEAAGRTVTLRLVAIGGTGLVIARADRATITLAEQRPAASH